MEQDVKIKRERDTRRFLAGLVVAALVAFGALIAALPVIKGWMEIAITPGWFTH
jgi:hypothetical protein